MAVIKRLIVTNGIAMVLGAIIFLIHSYLLGVYNAELTFSLERVYLFFQGFFVSFTIFMELVNKVNNLNIGYFFMATIVIKMIVFGVAFQDILNSEPVLSNASRYSLILPMLIYVAFEAYYSIKIVDPAVESSGSDLPE